MMKLQKTQHWFVWIKEISHHDQYFDLVSACYNSIQFSNGNSCLKVLETVLRKST